FAVLFTICSLTILSYTSFFFFNATATTEIYTLSLHDALPIWKTEVTQGGGKGDRGSILLDEFSEFFGGAEIGLMDDAGFTVDTRDRKSTRLNSSHVKISYAVFCLKKKKSD